jgi:hypothetical protein
MRVRLGIEIVALLGLAGAAALCVAEPPPVRNNSAEPAQAASPSLLERFLGARKKAAESAVLSEISQMDSAFKAYKERYGGYPPSDFNKLDDTQSPQYQALVRHIAHAFPHCDAMAEAAAVKKLGVKSPAQALCFWLQGLSPDPEHPVSKLLDDPTARIPMFNFEKARLKYPAGKKQCPVYVSEGGGDAPYVFFSHENYATQTPFNADFKQGGKGIARPYRSDNKDIGEFMNPKSFQIISAGHDGDFGGGKGSFPSGTGYQASDKDNLTNFADGTLGDAIPAQGRRK